MSDATQPVNTNTQVDQPEPPDAETVLGGLTREHLRNASPIVTDITAILTAHDSGTAAAVLREVLVVIALAAEAAAKRRPRNRPLEFAELTPPALRQVAALCRVWGGWYVWPATVELASQPLPDDVAMTPENAAAIEALPDATLTVAIDGPNVSAVTSNANGTVTVVPMTKEDFDDAQQLKADVTAFLQQRAPVDYWPTPILDPYRVLGQGTDPFTGPAPLADDPDAWFRLVPAQPDADPFVGPTRIEDDGPPF